MYLNLDNSKLQTKEKCEALYIVNYIFGLQAKNEGIHAVMGNVMHDGLEEHYKGSDLATVLSRARKSHAKVLWDLEDAGQPVNDTVFLWDNIKDKLTAYSRQFPVSSLPFNVLELEKTIGVVLDYLDFKVTFWGKRDVLVADRMTNDIVALDHKTRWGQVSDWWLKKFAHNSQFSGYIWLAQQHAMARPDDSYGFPADRIYMNCVPMPLYPQSTRMCSKHRVPYHECRLEPEHAHFYLETFFRTPQQLQAWRETLTQSVSQVGYLHQKFDGLERIPPAIKKHTTGYFTDHCQFCNLADWCRTGFSWDNREFHAKPYNWAPWDAGETQVVKEINNLG